MEPEQIKILKNVAIGVGVLGILIGGYVLFTKSGTAVPSDTVAVSGMNSGVNPQSTELVGADISRKIADLEALRASVEKSAGIFKGSAFKNLVDFSATVHAVQLEDVQRDNPFIVTDWKLKMKAKEDAAKKQAGQGDTTQAASVTVSEGNQSVSIATPNKTTTNLLGDFGTKAKATSTATTSGVPKNGTSATKTKTQPGIGGDFFAL